jgi:hypothetical protein
VTLRDRFFEPLTVFSRFRVSRGLTILSHNASTICSTAAKRLLDPPENGEVVGVSCIGDSQVGAELRYLGIELEKQYIREERRAGRAYSQAQDFS